MCRKVYPGIQGGLCFFHVQKAWIERLWEKAKGVLQLQDGTFEKSSDEKATAYRAVRKALTKIMYLQPKATEEETLEEANRMLSELCDKYASANRHANKCVVLHLCKTCHTIDLCSGGVRHRRR
jgi:hypothetical protein